MRWHEFTNASREFRRRERLLQQWYVPRDLGGQLGISGDQQHRLVRQCAAQPFRQFDPVHLGHPDVADDDVERPVREDLESLVAGRRFGGRALVRGEADTQRVANCVLVLDEQDRDVRFRSRGLGRGSGTIASVARGRVTTNVLPRPGLLLATMSPPRCETMP